MSLEVIEKFIPEGYPNRPRPLRKNNPIAVIIHYTANFKKSANSLAHVKYVSRNCIKKDGVTYELDGINKFTFGSGHIYIDSSNTAYRVLPYNEYCPGAGDIQLPKDNGYNGQTKLAHEMFNHNQNYMTIQYELCVNSDGDWNKTVENAIEIIAKDMDKYKYPLEIYGNIRI